MASVETPMVYKKLSTLGGRLLLAQTMKAGWGGGAWGRDAQ